MKIRLPKECLAILRERLEMDRVAEYPLYRTGIDYRRIGEQLHSAMIKGVDKNGYYDIPSHSAVDWIMDELSWAYTNRYAQN